MKTPFLNPKLDGLRFGEHTVPLEILKDWAAFEELIAEVARHLYFQDYPERKRVPSGFTENFALHLSAIKDGSAVPVIERVATGGAEKFSSLYDRARGVVLATITAASIGAALPPEFPRAALRFFDPFGRSLRQDEKIELIVPNDQNVTRYTPDVRKRLVLMGAKEYRQVVNLRGKVTRVDTEKHLYSITLVNGERVDGDTPAEYAARIRKALDPEATRVLVRAFVAYDPDDRPHKIEQVLHFEELEQDDVSVRVEELGLLRAGWLDGSGKAPLAEGIRWLADSWDTSYPDELPAPFVYPTPEGDVQVEWTFGPWELSATINLASKTAELSAVKVGSSESYDATADLATADGWMELADFVRVRTVS